MSNYIPRPGAPKKHDILAKREEELRHSIRAEDPPKKLEKHVEKLRGAQLALCKALIHEEVSKGNAEKMRTKYIEKLKQKAEYWDGLPMSDIVSLYQDNKINTEQEDSNRPAGAVD